LNCRHYGRKIRLFGAAPAFYMIEIPGHIFYNHRGNIKKMVNNMKGFLFGGTGSLESGGEGGNND